GSDTGICRWAATSRLNTASHGRGVRSRPPRCARRGKRPRSWAMVAGGLRSLPSPSVRFASPRKLRPKLRPRSRQRFGRFPSECLISKEEREAGEGTENTGSTIAHALGDRGSRVQISPLRPSFPGRNNGCLHYLADASADFRDVEVDDLVGHVFHSIAFRNALLKDGCALEKGLWRRKESAQLGCERLDVAGWNERHVDAGDNLRDVADIGCNQGHLRGCGLEHDIGEGFSPRRHDDAAGSAKRGARRELSGKRDPRIEAESTSEPLEAALVRSLADDEGAAGKHRLMRGKRL